MKYGVREITNVTMKAKSTIRFGNKTFYKDEPVLYFDSLKTSSLEGATTTVYATGGRGNVRLVAWEGEKTLTFNMEDALISPESFSVLSGAGLVETGVLKNRTQISTNFSADTFSNDIDDMLDMMERFSITDPIENRIVFNQNIVEFNSVANQEIQGKIRIMNLAPKDEFLSFLKAHGSDDYEVVEAMTDEQYREHQLWFDDLDGEKISIALVLDGQMTKDRITFDTLSTYEPVSFVGPRNGKVTFVMVVDNDPDIVADAYVVAQRWIDEKDGIWPSIYVEFVQDVLSGYAHTTETVVITKDENDVHFVSISKPHYGTIYLKSLKNMLKNTVIEEEDKISSKTQYQYEDGDVRGDLFVGQAIADYYTPIYNKTIKTLSIGMESFGSNFYLEADTLFRDTNGSDHPALFTIPNCKVQSNFTFTMASSGDPSTFSFVLDAFPGYTRFDDSKKVLASLVIVENGGIEELDSYRV